MSKVQLLPPREPGGKPRVRMKSNQAVAAAQSQAMREIVKSWSSFYGDADGANADLEDLVSRAWDLMRNEPLVIGALDTHTTNVIGPGLRLQARVDDRVLGISEEQGDAWERRTEFLWRMWFETTACDVERQMNGYDHQDLAFRTKWIAGDSFTHMPFQSRRDSAWQLKLHQWDPSRVSNPNCRQDSRLLSGGVKRSPGGAVVSYFVRRAHPGTQKIDGQHWIWDEVNAFGRLTGRQNVIHLFDKRRPEQSRGRPILASVMASLKQLGRYREAEMMAAVIGAMFTVFVKTEDGGPLAWASDHDLKDAASDLQIEEDKADALLGNGTTVYLGENEDVEIANPGRPNQAFDPFVLAVLRQVAVGVDLPFELLIRHFQSSYSASRAALLEAWKSFTARRRHVALHWCRPVYENWMAESVAKGIIEAPGFETDPIRRAAWLGAAWIGPPKGMINPAQEIRAEQTMNEMRIKSLDQIAMEMTGETFGSTFPRIRHEERLIEQLQSTLNQQEQ